MRNPKPTQEINVDSDEAKTGETTLDLDKVPKFFLSSEYISKNLITIGSLIIITLGIAKLSYFYSAFSIDILEFIQVSEILTLYLLDAIVLCFFFLITSFIIFLLQQIEIDLLRKKHNLPEVKIDRKAVILYIILTVAFLALRIYEYFHDDELYLRNRNIFLIPLIYLVTVYAVKIKLDKVIKKEVLVNLILTGFIVLMWNLIMTDRKIADLKYHSADKIYHFNYRDSTIESTEKNICIGQTTKYLFIYNQVSKITYVYEKDQISNLSIKTNNLIKRK